MRTPTDFFRRPSQAAAILLGLCLAGPAAAAGQFDGIYQFPGVGEYYSVHQNGSHMIVGNFIVENSSQVTVVLGNGQQFTSQRLDYWNLFSGPVSGSTAQLAGEAMFGACSLTATAQFSTTGVTVTVNSITSTPAGALQGINCATALPTGAGTSYGLVKVF